MSSSSNTGKAGIIKAADDAGSVGKLTHIVLDDLLYNIVHDLLIKVHRDEKIARAATAAIRVEKLASDASDSSLTTESRPDIKAETDAAVYDEGSTEARPQHNILQKHPYIDKPGYDIYGQTWVAQGPGRGKKKKDMEKKVETTPQDTPGATPTPEEGGGGKGGAASRPPNVLSFPSATCVKCKRCILVTRLNNHMGSCIGNSGRNASRAAAQKISNGSSNGAHNGSQGDGSPANSQKGTPLPGSRASSPNKKRDSDEVDDDDDTDNDAHKKKKLKPSAANPTKKVILKTKGGSGPGLKKEKVKTSSLLSVEQKVDDDDAEGSTVEVAPKKKISKAPSPAKKLKLGVSKPLLSSPGTTKNGKTSKSNGGGGGGGGDDGESESSGTLSSPPVV
ncbi:hypothetical protein PG984_010788 [Apiospora sp. TS-2023a]